MENYGNASQINYPLFSLEKACEFLCRFRAYGTHSHTYEIWCEDGTYNYTTPQNLFHPACSVVGTFLLIRPRTSLIVGQTPKVIFKNISPRGRNSNDAVATAYSNVSIHMCGFTSENKISVGFYDHKVIRTRISGCEFSNLVRAVTTKSNWSHVGSWYDSNDVGTLENIWSKQTPTYIHDCDIGLSSEHGTLDIGGFIRIDATNFGITSTTPQSSITFSDWLPGRLDIKSLNPMNVWSCGIMSFYFNDLTYPHAVNTVKTGVTMTSVDQVFNVVPGKLGIDGVVYLNDPSSIILAGLNQNMF